MDYESPLARRVAGDVWSGLSQAALKAGYTSTTALWESLGERWEPKELGDLAVCIFALGQDRPDAVDAIGALGTPRLYGLVVAVPERPSPLAGSLLYQGVRRLADAGVRAGKVEPALLRALPGECERYARRLFARLEGARRTG